MRKAGVLALVLGALLIGRIDAAAPTFQAPGFFRYALGDFMVTALQDGVIKLPTKGYQGLAQGEIDKLVADDDLMTPEGVPTSVNAYLVDTGAHRILVDGGNANCYGWKLGGLIANLKAAGYMPDQIDIIVLTHLHGDHVCGLAAADGQRAFPKAIVWAAKAEADFWLDEKNPAHAMVAQALAPYGKDLRTFTAADDIAPGMRIVPAPGHTPGHTAYLFESKGASLLAFGDIVHLHPAQFSHPDVAVGSDTNKPQAVTTRKALFERAASEKLVVAGSHLPFPGLGHIRKDGAGYVWLPVTFGAAVR